jgi:hypothetical protein
MATATTDTAVPAVEPTLRERVVDTARRVAHMSHEARMLKSIASDAVEDGVYKALRAMKNARRDIDDVRGDAVYRIKKQPVKAVGVAFGAGVCLGIAAGALVWLAIRSPRQASE